MHAENKATAEAFQGHNGYHRMFAKGRLTIGLFLPLRFYRHDMTVLHGQADLVAEADRRGFAAVWVRDIPLFDPHFGDAGQIFDPFVYLAYLAAQTKCIALVTGSIILPLRHPIDLAKSAASVDRLSGGRLVLGVAAGDRPSEFPAYGVAIEERADRFRKTMEQLRQLLDTDDAQPSFPSILAEGLEVLPKPVIGRLPLLVTGSCGQSMDWIAREADGWLTYPGKTDAADGAKALGAKIANWRTRLPDGVFRPHITNEWLDLVDDRSHPRTALDGGRVLRTGVNGLLDLLAEWREVGVNHAALGIQFSSRPPAEIIQQLAEDVLPHFPSLAASPAWSHW